MVVLHQGMLADFSCDQRMGIVFLGAILLQAIMLARYAWEVRFPRSYYGTRESYPIETLEDRPFFTRRRLIVVALWTTIVVTVAVVCMASRTETLLWMDGNFITETSCVGPFAQEYKLDRAQATIADKVESNWLQNSSKADNYLAISQPGQSRKLFIELKGRQNAPELIDLAPQAMKHYAEYLHDLQGARSP